MKLTAEENCTTERKINPEKLICISEQHRTQTSKVLVEQNDKLGKTRCIVH